MPSTASVQALRRDHLARLFPAGAPCLWCPPITHYAQDGAIDRARTTAHYRFMSRWIKAFLVPGSTGDGWELTPAESRQVLSVALEEAQRLDLTILGGALRIEANEARQSLAETLAFLKSRAGVDSVQECLRRNRVCGFAVCPPRGRELTHPEMEAALVGLLETGFPLALYQLPQVTQNEMSPALVASLARRFGNFVLFKDTSGTDRVAKSEEDLNGLFLVRGAEGDYANWLRTAGGPYDGFLLSSANACGAQLHQITQALRQGAVVEAQRLSLRLSSLIGQVFDLVKSVPDGNPFANANKALDHFTAHGPRAALAPAPRLHSGRALPVEVLRATSEILARHDWMPAKGYLE